MRKTNSIGLAAGLIIGLGATVFAPGASAQGLLSLTGYAGFNTDSADPNAATGWYNGNIMLEVFTIGATGNSAMVTTLNSELASLQTAPAAFSSISQAWTQQQVGSTGGSAGTQADHQVINIFGGGIADYDQGDYMVGTAGSLPQNVNIYYALLFMTGTGLEGAIVMNNPATGYLPSTSQANDMNSEYPTSDQNVFLAPSPEPTSLVLAGFAGLTMFLLRRRRVGNSVHG